MSKFQVGDKVKAIIGGRGVAKRHIGKIFTIAKINCRYYEESDAVQVVEPSEKPGNWNHPITSFDDDNHGSIAESSFEFVGHGILEPQCELASVITQVVAELKGNRV